MTAQTWVVLPLPILSSNLRLQGFYNIYHQLFNRLAAEEAMFEPGVTYPSFGYSDRPWATAKSSGEPDVRSFYTAWTNFATAKDFAWADQWNLNEAPDRRVRRCVAFFPPIRLPLTLETD